jgi:hypothetical protein
MILPRATIFKCFYTCKKTQKVLKCGVFFSCAAFSMSAETNPEAEFGYGSGHINPVKAINPGLIYDAGEEDYVRFLCGQGYSNKQLRLVKGDDSSCSEVTKEAVWNLNYPSLGLSVWSGHSITRVFHRIVTNVESPESSYKAIVKAPNGLKIKVTPKALRFKYVGQIKSFCRHRESQARRNCHFWCFNLG